MAIYQEPLRLCTLSTRVFRITVSCRRTKLHISKALILQFYSDYTVRLAQDPLLAQYGTTNSGTRLTSYRTILPTRLSLPETVGWRKPMGRQSINPTCCEVQEMGRDTACRLAMRDPWCRHKMDVAM